MIGEIPIKFLKKLKKKKSNPIAKDLRTSKYKQRSVPNKKNYNRKKTRYKFKNFRQTNFDPAIFLIRCIPQYADH